MGTSTINTAGVAAAVNRPADLRLRDAEHRHTSSLQILSNLVRRSLREAEAEETREVLSSVSELIDTIVSLHKLCHGSADDLATMLRGMGRQWQRLCNGHIRIEVDAEEGLDIPQSSQTVAILITQELVMNAIKHAFPGQHRGTISIRLYSSHGKDATIAVEDDGMAASMNDAIPCHKDASAHGRALVRDFALTLGGRISRSQARQGYGQCVTFCWPL